MKLSVSVCVPAHNEAKNIRHNLWALLHQKTSRVAIRTIIVVSSDSTDETNAIVDNLAKTFSCLQLIKEPERLGKAHAINTFLRHVDDEVVVVVSADTIPDDNAIEELCAPFLGDSRLGMTGGAPVPVNDPHTFFGYIVHAWWWFHRNIPRFGEIIAFRNIIPTISEESAVDEAYIQAKMLQKGYKVVHIDTAIVRNKGPETFRDIIIQRRRIFNGHARLESGEGIRISNMTKNTLRLMLFTFQLHSLKELLFFISGIAIEGYARLLGFYDLQFRNKNPYVWESAKSTKSLEIP